MDGKDNHSRFLKHLSSSHKAVYTIANWLLSRGYCVQIPPSTTAPTHKQWAKHADNGDIYANGDRIEVKQLSAEFTNQHDWPFKNKFIVCAKHAWNAAIPKPRAFFYLNKHATHLAIAYGHHHTQWNTETRTDARYNNVSQQFLFSPIHLIDWRMLTTP
jgi:hypothetical protein